MCARTGYTSDDCRNSCVDRERVGLSGIPGENQSVKEKEKKNKMSR